MKAVDWITRLQLAPHPEGGFYRETYHANHVLEGNLTLQTYGGPRRTASSIYFLLEAQDVSKLHRLKSDELWYFHAGHPLTVHIIAPNGEYRTTKLGLDFKDGQEPQRIIDANHIFGASIDNGNEDAFALVSCMVSPGFEFADFELFETHALLQKFPQHEEIITRLT